MNECSKQPLRGAVRYFDGLTNDARLVIDTLRSAAASGAVLLNYAALLSADRSGAEWRCTVRDELSGETGEVRARTVVNAAGAWAGALPHSRVRLRLTKVCTWWRGARRFPSRRRWSFPRAAGSCL